MRVRILKRQNKTLHVAPNRRDNIFSDIRNENLAKAISPTVEVQRVAKVLRPKAFEIDATEVVTKSSPAHIKGISCFCASGLVVTPAGPKQVGEITVGDHVLTRDNGFQPVRFAMIVMAGAARPSVVEISSGAIQAGKPSGALRVAGRQRILITGADVSRDFGQSEVLVRAGDLLHLEGFREVQEEQSHVAILFDNHEILRVNDAWLASMRPDLETRSHMDHDQQAQLLTVVPNLKHLPIERSYPSARPNLTAQFARQVRLSRS